MTSTSTLPTIALHYQDNRSDKVYHLKIEAKDGAFIVHFAYGRRGSTLKPGFKPSNGVAVSLSEAQQIYQEVLDEKLNKGYVPIAGQAPFSGTANAGRVSGLLPQLSNEIEDSDFLALIQDDDYFFQEKKDGHRVMIRKRAGKIEGINRRGLTIALPTEVHDELVSISGDFVLDGEMISDVFWAFDMLASLNDPDLARLGAEPRYRVLNAFIGDLANAAQTPLKHAFLVPAAFTAQEKEALYHTLLAQDAEGLVAKLKSSPHTPGKPASGGPHLKRKFKATATVRVARINLKRSVLVEVLAEDGVIWQPVGNVSIPANKEIPEIGHFAEVRYTYAFKGGNLIQPFYLGARNDVVESDCSIAQLKYKAGAA